MRPPKETKLQQYQEMQAMVQKEIRTMFPDLYKQQAQAQYDINKIPTHTHNGTDSVRIEEVNLIPNVKYVYGINANSGGATEVLQIRVVPNMQQLLLTGFAANNLGGPATKRATINGNACFGRVYTFSAPGSVVTPDSPIIGIPLGQAGSSMFVDTAALANQRVALSVSSIIYVLDSAAAVVAQGTIDSYENGVLQMTITLEADWQLFFSLTIS